MEKLAVILGPTSTGKTSLAIRLCQKFNGEIISADSRQIYRYADIGTNKKPLDQHHQVIKHSQQGYWIIDQVKINLYDIVDPNQEYSASRFFNDAAAKIRTIWSTGKLPFIVGGSGFYISALLGEVKLSGVPANPKLRRRLAKFSTLQLQNYLQKLNPKRLKQMDRAERNNPHRLTRAIEIAIAQQAQPDLRQQQIHPLAKITRPQWQKRGLLKIGLYAPRQELYQRADNWVNQIISSKQLLQETRRLIRLGYGQTRLLQGMIYAPTVKFIQGQIAQPKELQQIIYGQVHNYIRRQINWFKRTTQTNWFNITQPNYQNQVEKLVRKWYSTGNSLNF